MTNNNDNIVPFEKPATPQPPSEPILNLPPMVKKLAGVNIAVFLASEFFVPQEFFYKFAFIPARYFGDMPFDIYALMAPVTHMFIHGGWLHIVMNLGMLLAFGTGIEKALGQKKFLVFYFLCGFAGALCHLLLNPTSATPMIGASGAISGLFGGILLMMQSQGLMGEGFKKLMPFVALWILMSLFFGWIGMPGSDSSIAWATHVGGFIAGLLAYKFVQKLRV